MGYSIYVAAPTKELQQTMLQFLHQNFAPFPGIVNVLSVTDDLSYASDGVKYPIGFDYGAICSEERAYAYLLVYWISRVLTEAPHVYYYDDEVCTALEREEGVETYFGGETLAARILAGRRLSKAKDFITAQLLQLEIKWENYEED